MDVSVKPNLQFDEKTEKAYKVWLDGDSQRLLRLALGFGAAAYLINHLGDYAITGADIDALLMVRVSVASILIGVLGMMFLFKNINPTVIVISMTIILSAANTIMAQFMPGGGAFWLSAVQALVALILTMVVLRFRDLIIVATMIFIVPTGFAAVGAHQSDLIVMEGFFLATAAIGMVFIGHFVEKGRRTIFKLSQDLQYSATHDNLTGAFNRMQVLIALEHEMKKFERFKSPVTVLCIDIDRFKSVNDTYGHAAGDEVLKALTERVAGEIRDTDFFGRIGGEEFLVVLPDTNIVDAENMAERLRQVVEDLVVTWHDKFISCTISIGLGQMARSDDLVALLMRADHALYLAKDNGRNRVETEKSLSDTSGHRLNELISGTGVLGAESFTSAGQNA